MQRGDMSETSEYPLRTYIQGDETALIRLFNKAYAGFAGLIPRTPEYWKWCILSRPNVSQEGIAIVTHNDEIVGYAAVEKSGTILEFCYNPNYDGKKIVSLLMQWCIDYARHQESSSVSLNAPVQDQIIRQVCEELDFTQEPFPALFLKVQDFPQLLEKTVSREKNLKKDIEETVLFNFKEVPSGHHNHITLQIQNGTATVLLEKAAKPTITIDTSLSTVSACIFGSKRRLIGAITKGQLKVRPLRKILRSVEIFSLLQLQSPWYISGADFG